MENNNTNIPAGYKSSELGVIPEGWEVKRMKQIVSYTGGGAFSSKDASENGVKWLKIANVGINEIKWQEQSYLPVDFVSEYPEFTLKSGDIVLALTRPILDGKLKIAFISEIDTPCLLNQRVAKVVAKKCNKKFIYYYMQTPRFIADMEADMLGTDPPNASFESMYKQRVILPSLVEQERIAEILGTWDRAIELQGRKVALLQRRKRALMQQLLTPHRRLPNFSEPWKTTKLGEIGNTYNGLTGKTKEDFGFGLPYISYMTVFNSSKIKGKIMDYVNIGETETQNTVKYGDVFFTVSSETPEEVGMSSVLLDNINNTYLNSFCFGYRLFNFETLLPEFAQFYFRSKKFRIEMYMLAQGSTRFNISKSEVLKLKIKLPCIDEQRAISEVLTTADREIELATQNLTALRSQKRALMQQLLTGKKRLKYDI